MTFEFTTTDTAIAIRDTVENATTSVRVDPDPEPRPAATDAFRVPLDAAVRVETTAFALAENVQVIARQDGEFVGNSTLDEELHLDAGRYELETTLAPFKLYLLVDAAVHVVDLPTGTRFTFDHETAVTIGVRSHHQRPAGVVTTTQDPRDIMRAVSTFGSAMKTFSPERSYPTLRGHPPELAVRGQTTIPDAFAPPDTGITVEIPPEYSAIFTAAPLAYYLGATLESGLSPRLHAADAVHDLDETTLAADVRDLLAHCFVLDGVVRSIGRYPFETRESHTLTDHMDLDRQTLYDLPLAERTARYLDVSRAATRDLLRWPSVADVDPAPRNAEVLPYLTYRMAAIRSPAIGTPRDSTDTDRPAPPTTGTDTRGFLPGAPDTSQHTGIVEPASFDVQQHIWVADGLPAHGVKPTLGAYLRSTDADPHTGPIDVHIVRGTDDPPDIETLADRYQNDAVDVTLHDTPTTNALKDLLLRDVDFLHYWGDVTADGLACVDGTLDVRTLPRSGVSAFFLDGECSYRQGLSLLRVGAVAGVVTTDDTPPADPVGDNLAHLLDEGFSVAAAVDVVSTLNEDAPYAVVGDGDHQICTQSSLPLVWRALPDENTAHMITAAYHLHPNRQFRVGSTVCLPYEEYPGYSLTGDVTFTLDRETFTSFAERLAFPIVNDGDIHWPEGHTPDELWAFFR